jgi:hypothetical protein
VHWILFCVKCATYPDKGRMTYSIDAYHVTTYHQPSARKFLSQKLLGGAALGCVALACAWTLYANVAATRVDAVVAEQPAMPPVPASSAEPLFDVALIHSTFSLGLPAERLSQRAPLESHLQPGPAAFRNDTAMAPDAAPREPAVNVVQSVPLPTPRPSELRSLQSRTPMLQAMAQQSKARQASPAQRAIQKLFGTPPESGPALAYAAADGGVFGNGQSITSGRLPPDDGLTAVYDISARTVHMPDGTRLEAHSGLGGKLDDPRYVHVKMHGATPPHVYDLVPREALFHGVQALRLIPAGGEGAIFGRTGLLTHSYLLGPNGDSNGCVSFKNYDAFLRAYQNDKVKRLVVVASLD